MKHQVTRECDEYACTCGLRWDVKEEDPHGDPVEAQYQNGNKRLEEIRKTIRD